MHKLNLLRTISASIILALLMMTVFGNMAFPVKAFDFLISIQLSGRGETEINIPPVGTISALTHITPVKIKVDLQNINMDVLKTLISEAPNSEKLITSVKQDLIKTAYTYCIILIILAGLGGFIGAILINGRKWKYAVTGASAGILISLLIIGLTISTYNIKKFRNPEYRGILKSAPWAINLAETALQQVGLLSEQMKIIASNIYNLYEGINLQQPIKESPGDLDVLLVSDIHNNPAAHTFLQQIIKDFAVDMVIDTGDMTDYGTPLEGLLLKDLRDIRIPYLFIPGNHDSPITSKELSGYPQVHVLKDGIVDILGLKILSFADPSSYSNEISSPNTDIIKSSREKLYQLWSEAEVKPNILAVHNYKIAEPLVSKVPLIINGHTHQVTINKEANSVIINAGTTGGAGIRGLQAVKEIPCSVILIHFKHSKDNSYILYAADIIKVYNLDRGFIIERKILSQLLKPHV
jgi:predicted phosphodiesterase